MSPSAIFGPFFGVMLLTLVVWISLFATNQVDGFYVGAGWIFASFRALHSAVHCSFNHIMTRFSLYLIASLALWTMLARAALAHFGA